MLLPPAFKPGIPLMVLVNIRAKKHMEVALFFPCFLLKEPRNYTLLASLETSSFDFQKPLVKVKL